MEDTQAVSSEQELLASLPPPPSAFPDLIASFNTNENVNNESKATPALHQRRNSRSSASTIGNSVASVAGIVSSNLTSSFASASLSFHSLLSASQNATDSNANDVNEALDIADQTSKEVATVAAVDALIAAKLLQEVTVQQRMKILEELIQHRRFDWNYLKTMHEGSNYWLNIALLREQQVLQYIGKKPRSRRSAQFFYLGLGLGKLVEETPHPELLAMNCCQLLEELEFFFASTAVQSMKMMVATSSTLYDKENFDAYSTEEAFRPSVYKWNQRPMYRRLMTPPIPFPLDYREVLLSLCDILALVYSKLIEDNGASENIHLFQSILRFDNRIQKLVIDPIKKEFAAVAAQVVAEEMRLVRIAYAAQKEETKPSISSESSGKVLDAV
ncbi:hypothetical protein CCR75_001072 [Bremia lactucae]|uniref:Uncharacterized protein n=1 Tax=Bremia lactucae TaxID=4779 RepID=A0A976IHG1_BRELC|nr:hypothetical protein CCR75_001072 [Bremia lactucae]